MKTIPLGRGIFTLVDNLDYYRLRKYRWYCARKECKDHYIFYAQRNDDSKNRDNRKVILMHRQILNLSSKDNVRVQHIDHNGLNNVRKNLKIKSGGLLSPD